MFLHVHSNWNLYRTNKQTNRQTDNASGNVLFAIIEKYLKRNLDVQCIKKKLCLWFFFLNLVFIMTYYRLQTVKIVNIVLLKKVWWFIFLLKKKILYSRVSNNNRILCALKVFKYLTLLSNPIYTINLRLLQTCNTCICMERHDLECVNIGTHYNF